MRTDNALNQFLTDHFRAQREAAKPKVEELPAPPLSLYEQMRKHFIIPNDLQVGQHVKVKLPEAKWRSLDRNGLCGERFITYDEWATNHCRLQEEDPS